MGILGGVVALLAVMAALLATALYGLEGGIVAAVLAVLAIVFGILKRRKDKKGGIAAIIIAVLAIILSFAMTNFWSNAYKVVHDKAVEFKPDGLWAKASEETNHGLMGIINKLPTDEASLNALMEEMNELNKLTEAEK